MLVYDTWGKELVEEKTGLRHAKKKKKVGDDTRRRNTVDK